MGGSTWVKGDAERRQHERILIRLLFKDQLAVAGAVDGAV